jgi:hypothetical protein
MFAVAFAELAAEFRLESHAERLRQIHAERHWLLSRVQTFDGLLRKTANRQPEGDAKNTSLPDWTASPRAVFDQRYIRGGNDEHEAYVLILALKSLVDRRQVDLVELAERTTLPGHQRIIGTGGPCSSELSYFITSAKRKVRSSTTQR